MEGDPSSRAPRNVVTGLTCLGRNTVNVSCASCCVNTSPSQSSVKNVANAFKFSEIASFCSNVLKSDD